MGNNLYMRIESFYLHYIMSKNLIIDICLQNNLKNERQNNM